MIPLVVLGVLMAAVSAQRPSYAGTSPIGYPGLASRFKDTSDSSTNGNNLAPTSSGTTGVSASSGSDVIDRLGGNDNAGVSEKIPVDARGDANLVNRLNQWPRENRPFWLLNAEHIEKQRNTPSSKQAAGGAVLQSRNALDTEQTLFYKPVIRRVTEVPNENFFVRSDTVNNGHSGQYSQPRSNYGTY